MISKTITLAVGSALRSRRQKKAAIQARRTQKSKRLDFNQLERRNLLATFVVNTAVDDASGATDGLVSLREAIIASNTNQSFGDAVAGSATGDRIVFDASINGVAHLIVNGEYEITDDLVIVGGDSRTEINGRSESRIFRINTSETVGLSNLILRDGRNRGGEEVGGAIFSASGGTTRLNNLVLISNNNPIFTSNGSLYATALSARDNFGDAGGVIEQVGGNVGIFDSVFDDNSGISSGAISVVDGTFFASNTTIGGSGRGGNRAIGSTIPRVRSEGS